MNVESWGTYVMAANMSWKTQKTIDGTRVLPIEGFSRTPLRPKYPTNETALSGRLPCTEMTVLTEISNVCVGRVTER